MKYDLPFKFITCTRNNDYGFINIFKYDRRWPRGDRMV